MLYFECICRIVWGIPVKWASVNIRNEERHEYSNVLINKSNNNNGSSFIVKVLKSSKFLLKYNNNYLINSHKDMCVCYMEESLNLFCI